MDARRALPEHPATAHYRRSVHDASPRRRPRALALVLAGFALLALVVAMLLARWWRDDPAGAAFIAEFPGAVAPPPGTPTGFPAWLSWTHFLNGFFLLFIVSSALHLRAGTRPPAFVTRRNRWPPPPCATHCCASRC